MRVPTEERRFHRISIQSSAALMAPLGYKIIINKEKVKKRVKKRLEDQNSIWGLFEDSNSIEVKQVHFLFSKKNSNH